MWHNIDLTHIQNNFASVPVQLFVLTNTDNSFNYYNPSICCQCLYRWVRSMASFQNSRYFKQLFMLSIRMLNTFVLHAVKVSIQIWVHWGGRTRSRIRFYPTSSLITQSSTYLCGGQYFRGLNGRVTYRRMYFAQNLDQVNSSCRVDDSKHRYIAQGDTRYRLITKSR